jgi:hypothetical protein
VKVRGSNGKFLQAAEKALGQFMLRLSPARTVNEIVIAHTEPIALSIVEGCAQSPPSTEAVQDVQAVQIVQSGTLALRRLLSFQVSHSEARCYKRQHIDDYYRCKQKN